MALLRHRAPSSAQMGIQLFVAGMTSDRDSGNER